MRHLLAIPALIAPAIAFAQAPAVVALPDTPAGRFVAVFLDAYNSADQAKLLAYNARYGRKSAPQVWIDMHATTGRLTPVQIAVSTTNEITVLLGAEHGDAFWQEKVSIDPANPLRVLDAGLGQAERPPEFAIPRLPRAALDRAMTAKLAGDVAADRFAGTILVQRHGRPIYRAALGLADRTSKLPVAMDTRFRIGSANKMFTAVAILQLVERGKLSLDAPVGTYLRDYPNKDFAQGVTIRQLLSHTGGAGDIFTPEYEARRQSVRSPIDYVALFGGRAPATGTARTEYANYGFVLLGRVVEVVGGEDYHAYLDRQVFAPAGMRDTGSLPEEAAVPRRARGYTRRGGRLVDNADTLPWRGSPAGGGYSTAADLMRFGEALLAGRLVSKATLAQATSPRHPDGWYGLGFWIGGSGPTRSWGHGGGAPGMNAAFRVYPELDAVIVALSNLDPLAADNQADFYANRMALGE